MNTVIIIGGGEVKKSINNNELSNSISLFQPNFPILCTTKNKDGSDNVAPFSWIKPVSRKPPRISLSLVNMPIKQNSLVNIERTGEFVVNIPDIELAYKTIECSYRPNNGENKFERSGFNRTISKYINVCGIDECIANIECKALKLLDVGDHTLIIADILYSQYDERYYDENLLMNIDKFTPIIHFDQQKCKESQLHRFLCSFDVLNISVPYSRNIE